MQLGLLTAAASGSMLAASFAWVVVLAADVLPVLAWQGAAAAGVLANVVLDTAGPVLRTWGAGGHPAAIAAGCAVAGPVVLTAGLLAVTLRLRRRG